MRERAHLLRCRAQPDLCRRSRLCCPVPQAFHGSLEHEQSASRIDDRGLFDSAKARVIQRNHLVEFDELLHRVHLPSLASRRLDYARLMPYLGALDAMSLLRKG